jgi:hypothetical protein
VRIEDHASTIPTAAGDGLCASPLESTSVRRSLVLVLCGVSVACRCRSAEPASAVPAVASAPAPAAAAENPSPARYANRYLMIAAAKPDADSARAAAPAGATVLESTAFTGLKPCLFVAVVGDYAEKAEALAARKQLQARHVDAWPRHAGRYVPDDAERIAQCRQQAQMTLDAQSPRWVQEGGWLELHGMAGDDEDAGVRDDPAAEVHLGDRFDVYDALGARVVQGCAVKRFDGMWDDLNSDIAGHCGTRHAVAELDCQPLGKALFALPSAAPPPAVWAQRFDSLDALRRLLATGAVKSARRDLQKKATAQEPFMEENRATAWEGRQGVVTFVEWDGKTGEGAPQCGHGELTMISEVVLWPADKGPPRVLESVREADKTLIGVTDLGADGALELTWQSGDDVWMDQGDGTARRYANTHPWCGCGC